MKKENQIVEPPDELDGAKVITWAWSGDKPFGFTPIVNSDSDNNLSDPIEVYGLAICRYENSDNVYRFSCDKNWEVQQDRSYESVDDAMRQLPNQYKLETTKWKTK